MKDAVETRGSALRSRIGGAASVLVAVLLLLGLAGLAISLPRLGIRNWLVVIFQLNAGIGDFTTDPLRVFNPLDVVALVLVGVTFLSLWPGPGRPHRRWMTVAVALPFLGIAILMCSEPIA